jgi:hypothetical protein
MPNSNDWITGACHGRGGFNCDKAVEITLEFVGRYL